MGKYSSNENRHVTYVGMDVHARSIAVSAVDVETGEAFSARFCGNGKEAELCEWVEGLPQPAYCAYESGCTGFGLARELRSLGIDCDVIAVSTLPKSQRDRKRKCDRLDARAIRREICNPDSDYSVVWVPDERTEAERDLCRVYRTAVDTCRQARQRLRMFLLRHGHVWDERTKTGNLKKAWTRDFTKWLDSISFGQPSAEKAYAALRRQERAAAEEVAELRREVLALSREPHNKPYADALGCLKGVDREGAMLAIAEFGDFSRFGSGRGVSCWLGTVPTDASSGEHDRHGRITKCGDKWLRKALVEGWSGAASWKTGRKAVPKGAEPSAAAQAIAARANRRLFERYAHLVGERGKCHNKAKVAVVSELARWIWVVGMQVQAELQAPAA